MSNTKIWDGTQWVPVASTSPPTYVQATEPVAAPMGSLWADTDETTSFTPSPHAASHAMGGSDPITALSIGADETETLFRTSGMATISRLLANNGVVTGGGSVAACYTVCKAAVTYTQIRMYVVSAGTGVTGFKMGVWSADGQTLLSETANAMASLAANSWVTATLSVPLTLVRGDVRYLGFAQTNSTTGPSVRAFVPPATNFWAQVAEPGIVVPFLGRSSGAWAGGSTVLPGALAAGTAAGTLPLVELIA